MYPVRYLLPVVIAKRQPMLVKLVKNPAPPGRGVHSVAHALGWAMKAQYTGLCLDCHERIQIGDEIEADNLEPGNWVHRDCARHRPNLDRIKNRPRCIACADILNHKGECPNCGTRQPA